MKKFAADENLTLVRSKSGVCGSYYRGVYRHHHLRLEPFQKRRVGEKTYFCTRIRIGLDKVADSLLPKTPDSFSLHLEKAIKRLTPASSQYILSRAPFKNVKTPFKTVTANTIKQRVHLYYKQDYHETRSGNVKLYADLIVEMADAYSVLAQSGGKAVPFLKEMIANDHNKSIATALLKDISRKTTARFKDHISTLLCASCYTRCKPYKTLSESFELLPYYGCRICHQSHDILEGITHAVAILDNRNPDEYFKQDGILRVNWLKHRSSFDFAETEIVRATDEEVERFAVQAGNDNDPVRRPLYQKMHCIVASECDLTENTLRVLRSIFGEVEIKRDSEKSKIASQKRSNQI